MLLRYVCERCFEGSDDVKEFSIAADVFGRGPDFDQKSDSIVRVKAFRLRKRLKEFYETEGRDLTTRIVLPPGRYVPEFVEASPSGPAPPAAEAGAADPPRRWKAVMALAALPPLAALVLFALNGRQPPRRVQAKPAGTVPAVAVTPLDEVHILAGNPEGAYVDGFGQRWAGDRFFSGGSTFQAKRPVSGTRDQGLYHSGRYGDFQYDIPLAPRDYELRLYFAESDFGEDTPGGGGETSRVMNIRVNDKPEIQLLDILSAAGGARRAYVRALRGVKPAADGMLHLRFGRQMGGPPFVNAIEVTPMVSRRVRPIRMVIRDTAFVDHSGVAWFPDSFFSGGRTIRRDNLVTGPYDAELFRGERFGSFTYAIPLPPGRYTLSLYFAETYFGEGNPGHSGVGWRVFDVFCNHQRLLEDFDILREAGGANRAICRRFPGLQPDSKGDLTVEFVPRHNYACVNAIEVSEEAK